MSAGHKTGFEGFADWERQLVRKKAERKARELRRDAISVDDLEQEFLLQLWIKRKAYNPAHHSGASLKTFINRILDNKFRDIHKSEQKDKRLIHGHAVSLDAEMENVDGDESTFSDFLRDDQAAAFLDRTQIMEAASQGLNAFQKSIYQMIQAGFSVTQIARRKKIPWSSLKDEIIRMRSVLYDGGLKDALGFRDFPEKGRKEHPRTK